MFRNSLNEIFFFFQENVFRNVVSNLFRLVCVFKNIWDHPSIPFIGITVSVLRSLWFPFTQPENTVGHLITLWVCFNTLRPRHDHDDGCHFTDNIFKYIILNENVWISTDILLKFIPKGLIDNTAALVQIMAWRRSGAMPLSESTRTTRMPAFWDTPHRPMITHTSGSHQIPSQNKPKSKLQILKNCQKYKFWNFARNFTHDTPSEVAW